MKTFAKEFGKSMGIATLRTVKIASMGTLGLAGALLNTSNNLIVSGCNLGVQRLKGQKSTFLQNLEHQHDLEHLCNKIMDGRVSIVEAYDSVVPEDWKIIIDYLTGPYKAAAMDIDNAKA